MAARLPLRARLGVGLVVALLVVAVAGGASAIAYGTTALHVPDGGAMSSAATSRTWFGLELENPSAVAATLRSVRPVVASNARIVEARILDHEDAGDSGVGVMSPPVDGPEGAAIARARPVDGFVLPAHSRDRYQLIVLLERIRPGTAATLRQADVRFTALGLDHGFRSHAVLCIRAPGARDCP